MNVDGSDVCLKCNSNEVGVVHFSHPGVKCNLAGYESADANSAALGHSVNEVKAPLQGVVGRVLKSVVPRFEYNDDVVINDIPVPKEGSHDLVFTPIAVELDDFEVRATHFGDFFLVAWRVFFATESSEACESCDGTLTRSSSLPPISPGGMALDFFFVLTPARLSVVS